jgi:hypothetical protein
MYLWSFIYILRMIRYDRQSFGPAGESGEGDGRCGVGGGVGWCGVSGICSGPPLVSRLAAFPLIWFPVFFLPWAGVGTPMPEGPPEPDREFIMNHMSKWMLTMATMLFTYRNYLPIEIDYDQMQFETPKKSRPWSKTWLSKLFAYFFGSYSWFG